MDTFIYYGIVLLALIIGFLIVKRIANCFIKSIVTLVIIVALVVFYLIYFT